MKKYIVLLFLITLTSCKIKFLEPDVISDMPNSYYLTKDYIDLSNTALTTQVMDEYLANGNGYMLCFCGNLTDAIIRTIKNYINNCGKDIYLDLKNCTGLSTIPESIFSGVNNLVGIKLPHDTTTIGKYSFQNCTKLINVRLPLSLNSIGDYSFKNTRSLKEIEIPDSSIAMYQETFKNSGLVQFIMSDSFERIGIEALGSCQSLKTLVVNASFALFRMNALSYSSNLETIIYYGDKVNTVRFESGIFNGIPANKITLYLPNVVKGQADFSTWGGYSWKDIKYKGEFDINSLLQ